MRVLDLRLVPPAVGCWLAAVVLVGGSSTSAWVVALVASLVCAGAALWSRPARTEAARALPARSLPAQALPARTRPARTRLARARPARALRAAGGRDRTAGQVVLVAGALACVAVATGGQLAARESGMLAPLVERGARVEVHGTVVSEPAAMAAGFGGDPRYRLSLRLETVTGPAAGSEGGAAPRGGPVRGPAHGEVLLLGGPELLELPYGASVAAEGRLRAVDPGSATAAMLLLDPVPRTEDAETDDAGTDVAGTDVAETEDAGTSLASPGPPSPAATSIHVLAPPGPVLSGVNRIRAAFVEACARLPAQARGLVPGVAIGDTSMLAPALDEAMVVTSLTHMTAVSGSHFAIIAATVFGLCALARLPRWARVVVAGTAMGGFVLLVHPEPSVLRAAAMGAVALCAVLMGRPSQAVAALGASVVVLLVLDPYLARSYGFVLSVLATAGLVLGTAPITRRLERMLPSWLALALAVPVAAQLACAPVIVLLDPSVSTYAVPANLLAAPALVPATVLGVLGALCAPWWPAAATLLAQVAGWSTWWIAEVAQTFAAAPAARLPWLEGAPGAALLALVTVLGVLLVARWEVLAWRVRTVLFVAGLARAPSTPHPPGPLRATLARADSAVLRAAWSPVRSTALVLVVTLVAVLVVWAARPPWLGELAGGPAAGPAGWPPDWEVALCDVGQGDAMLVRTGPGRALMVDVGPADGEVGRCLDELGITTIETLVLTHFHADHVGALAEVLDVATVETALVSPVHDPAAQADAVLAALAEAGVDWAVADSRVRGGAAPVTWSVLWPAPGYPGVTGSVEGGANDGSLVLAVQTAHLSLVALGDLESAGQAGLLRVLRAGGAGEVDVVKMAHHGSATQDAGLARLLSPAVTLVSSGAGNTYGHPAQSALELYRGVGSAIVRTDTCSTVGLLVRDGQTLVAGTCA